MVASCLLEALLMFPQKLESRIGHQRWPYLRVILSFSTISLIQCASLLQNWSPEVAIFASNFEFFNDIFNLSSVCKRSNSWWPHVY